jgi:hypothetical protein
MEELSNLARGPKKKKKKKKSKNKLNYRI